MWVKPLGYASLHINLDHAWDMEIVRERGERLPGEAERYADAIAYVQVNMPEKKYKLHVSKERGDEGVADCLDYITTLTGKLNEQARS